MKEKNEKTGGNELKYRIKICQINECYRKYGGLYDRTVKVNAEWRRNKFVINLRVKKYSGRF
jgi:hypothetical protein